MMPRKKKPAAAGASGDDGAVKKKVAKKKVRRKVSKSPPASARKAPARHVKTQAASKPQNSSQTIHCTMARMGSAAIMLPTSAIAEITDYAPPAPLENTPAWLLGQVEWEDWQVPVICYSALINSEPPETATARSRIMVVRSLSNTTRVPFIGFLVSEIPKLAKVSDDELEVADDERKSLGVYNQVKMAGQSAVIPDLDRLSQLVERAAYGARDKGDAAAGPA